ncbi:hypothetical protein AX15_003852 [Amanita polypyramis BW_CC]|nr:hypothetical protein AX15_003852 [Amanita polypyramis BW_CC]
MTPVPAPLKAMQAGSSSAVSDDCLSGAVAVTRKPSFATWGVERIAGPSLSMHDGHHNLMGDESELTESDDCRHTRLRTVPEPSALLVDLTPHSAIPATPIKTSNLFGQNGPVSINSPASFPSSFLDPRLSVYPPQHLETSVSSLTNSNNHGITNSINRPRTSNQVFKTGEELALHYGIPTLLPPPPQTTPKLPHEHQQPPLSPVPDFETLRLNYLNMINQDSADNTMIADNTASCTDILPSSHMGQADVALEDWVNSITSAVPAQYGFDFLTSPITLGTPMQDFESSPNETPFSDFLNTPLLDHSDEFQGSTIESESPLFGPDDYYTMSVKAKTTELPEIPGLLYDMPPIPSTEVSVDPSTIYPSPAPPCPPASFSSLPLTSDLTPEPQPSTTGNGASADDTSIGNRRRSNATGTRKGVTADKLIPLNAPTQPRRYLMPSTTSRKEMPSMFLKKRKRPEVEVEEEDELLEPLPPNATEREQIDHKRRQNTLAARKSRKRKLEHQQELESKVETLADEVTRWRTRCDMLSKMLESHGIRPPTFSD